LDRTLNDQVLKGSRQAVILILSNTPREQGPLHDPCMHAWFFAEILLICPLRAAGRSPRCKGCRTSHICEERAVSGSVFGTLSC